MKDIFDIIINKIFVFFKQYKHTKLLMGIISCALVSLTVYFIFREGRGENDPPPNLKSFSVWEGNGIKFSYPGNWREDSEPLKGEDAMITISSPGYAVARFFIYSKDIPPLIVARSVYISLQSYSDPPETLTDVLVGKYTATGRRFKAILPQNPDIQMEITILSLSRGGKTYALMYLVPVEDEQIVKEAFDLIQSTFEIIG